MSRLYGRTYDVYSVSKYFQENYNKKYVRDNTKITDQELMHQQEVITPYLTDEEIEYLDKCNIQFGYNRFIRETIYSGYGEKDNIIIFPKKIMRESYKRELIYYFGDLLRRLNLDLLPSDYDIRCQYSNVLPLLLEYLFLRDTGKEDEFSTKHLSDLNLNAKDYIKMFEHFEKYKEVANEDSFLRNTLLFLVPLSSMDATLQITDNIANDKEELRNLIKELFENKENNREEIMKNRKIETYGFKRLIKEIDKRK